MSDTPENPKAFPDSHEDSKEFGMDLRDYIAAKAFAVLIHTNKDYVRENPNYGLISKYKTAKEAFDYADSFLKERAKR